MQLDMINVVIGVAFLAVWAIIGRIVVRER